MSKIVWDQIGEHFFETGTKNGVLYPYNKTTGKYKPGVAWNGLTAATETPEGAEANDQYADDMKYLVLYSPETFKGTIEAFSYPDEFKECDGSKDVATGVTIGQQERKTFGFCFRTAIGNDVDGQDKGYKLHLWYGCKASPSERSYATINDSPEAITFSWEVTTTPVNVDGYKPISTITIDSTKVDADKLASFLNTIYGTDGTVSYSAVTPVGSENPHTSGWYERSGTDPNYVYTLTEDTTVNDQKTYYSKNTAGATDPELPMPADVISHFAISG